MYGISIPNCCSDCADFIKRIDPLVMPILEIQGELILDRKLIEAANKQKLYLLNSYDYIKNSTIMNSLDQSEVFQDEVVSTIAVILSDPVYAELANITVDFGLFRELNTERILTFIHKLYFHINKSNKNIYMPVILPGMENSDEIIQKVFYMLMLNRFKVCLNIYPYELKKEFDYSVFIKNLSFRIDFVRICYDATLGNYITEKPLVFLKELFKKCDINPPMIFAPLSSNIDMLEEEKLKLCDLIRKI